MNSLKNSVKLIGFLGNTPEIKATDKGIKFAKFSIATNEKYQNSQGETVRETIWHSVIAWNKLAEIAEKFLNKGSEVAVEGKLLNRSYLDKDGIKRYVSEVQINELLLIGSKTPA